MNDRQESRPEEFVRLDLVLTGGHAVRARLHQDAALIPQLLQAFGGGVKDARPPAFGLPTADGHGTIFVRTGDIISIEMDRTIRPTEAAPNERQNTFVRYTNVLQCETIEALRRYVRSRQEDFRPSTIADNETGTTAVQQTHRVSEVLYDVIPFDYLFQDKVRAALPSVCQALGIDAFAVERIECQLTASRNGAFFSRHEDNSGIANASRMISYVYYFHTEPKQFDGGLLTFYPREGYPISLEPLNNSLIFFSSGVAHEVSIVRCPGSNPTHARFTVNGWIHSGDATRGG